MYSEGSFGIKTSTHTKLSYEKFMYVFIGPVSMDRFNHTSA